METNCTVTLDGRTFRGRFVGPTRCQSTGKRALNVIPDGSRAVRSYWPEQVKLDKPKSRA